MTDVKLLPSSVAAFTEALHGDHGSLDAWLMAHDEGEVRAHVEAYARANINVATAAKDAEIEVLRAEVERAQRDEALLRQALGALEYASDLTKPVDLQGCDCPICISIATLRERLGVSNG